MQDIQATSIVNRFSPKNRTPFFKMFGDDFMSGCRRAGMTPEQVGIYIFMLILEWEEKAPLADDMRRLSVACGWDIRIVTRLVDKLIAIGKYRRDDGLLHNQRMQSEIEIYVAKAKAKEAKKFGTSAGILGEVGQHRGLNEGLDKATLTPHLSRKDNKNNDGASEIDIYARDARVRVRSSEAQKPEREEIPLYPPSPHGAAFQNGRLVLFNGTKQFWLDKFGGDEGKLDLALAQAAGYVQPNSLKPLEAQVGAQLARMVRDKIDKDERYAKAVKANGKGPKEPELQKISRMVDEAFDRMRPADTTPKPMRLTHER